MRRHEIAKEIIRQARKAKLKENGRTVPIDWELVKKLLKSGCSSRLVASSLDIDLPYLRQRAETEFLMPWKEFKNRWKDVGIKEILEAQHELAVYQQDQKMLIWLGKVRAGQREADHAPAVNASAAQKIFKWLCDEEQDLSSNEDLDD